MQRCVVGTAPVIVCFISQRIRRALAAQLEVDEVAIGLGLPDPNREPAQHRRQPQFHLVVAGLAGVAREPAGLELAGRNADLLLALDIEGPDFGIVGPDGLDRDHGAGRIVRRVARHQGAELEHDAEPVLCAGEEQLASGRCR